MQSIKELLTELGFNPEAPLDTQSAFVKHLIRAANEITPTAHHKKVDEIKDVQTETIQRLDLGPAQMEFDFTPGKRVS